MKSTLWKIKSWYNKLLKKLKLNDDDIFWIKLIIWIFIWLGLLFLVISIVPEDAWILIMMIGMLIFLLYGIYRYRKEILQFIIDLFWVAKEIAGLILWILIIVGIIALCSWLFWVVWWWIAWVLAVFFVLKILWVL